MDKLLVITNLCHGSIRVGSPVSCEKPYKTIENIISISDRFDACLIINDNHSPHDGEFSYVPHHNMKDSADTARLLHLEKRLKCQNIQFLTKRTFSAFRSDHNKFLLATLEPKNIYLAGFSATFDILPTTLDLIQTHYNVTVISDCVDDLNSTYKDKVLDYLIFIGVPVLGKESI